jgi:hypothetical protein
MSYNKMEHCCLPDTKILEQTLPLSVHKLEIIVCSDWLVGSHRPSWLAEHKTRSRDAQFHR